MLEQDQNIDATQLSQPSSSKWCARLGSLGQKDQKWQGLFGLYDTFMHFVGSTQDTKSKEPLLLKTRFGMMYKAIIQASRSKPLSEKQLQLVKQEAGIVFSGCKPANGRGLSFAEVRKQALPIIAKKKEAPLEEVEKWMSDAGRPQLEATKWLGMEQDNRLYTLKKSSVVRQADQTKGRAPASQKKGRSSAERKFLSK